MGGGQSQEQINRHMRRVAREMIHQYGTPFVDKQILLSHGACRGQNDVDNYFAYIEDNYNRNTNTWVDVTYETETFDDLNHPDHNYGDYDFNQPAFNNGGAGGFGQNNAGGFGQNNGGFGNGGF